MPGSSGVHSAPKQTTGQSAQSALDGQKTTGQVFENDKPCLPESGPDGNPRRGAARRGAGQSGIIGPFDRNVVGVIPARAWNARVK